MKPQPWKRLGWWVFVGASASVTVVTAYNDDAAVTPLASKHVDKRTGKQAATPAAPQQRALALVSAELAHMSVQGLALRSETEIGNAFNVTSWHVAPPPPPPVPPPAPEKQAPPPKPTAPPMPFTYFGRYVDADVQVVMLVKGDQLYTVSEGDMIENIYRVERVAPGMVELTYLPLKIRQSIGTGDAS